MISVDDLKRHLNIDEDFHDDDAYIAELAQVAENVVFTHVDDTGLTGGENELPAALNHAVKLLVATWYANRESVAYGNPQTIPHAYDYLIALYKNYNPQMS